MSYLPTRSLLGSRPVIGSIPAWKRAIDLLVCLSALPLLILCTLAMTLVTKLVSPGPVLFRQERVGYQGRRFKIYKFRSMHVRADPVGHQNYFKDLVTSNAPMVKLDARGDTRLLPGAWLLRATGLDELPQLINVLRGEMSLVGPRPCLPSEAELYQPWQKERFETLPGLTGLWQVSGKNRTTFEEMMHLDIRYARTRAFWMDLRIMVMTIPALLVQVYDTRIGRRSSALGAHTVGPFAMTQDQSPTSTR
jgi:lipopolysaccharide/colanic/teichoic acid biosynthesis glycosyltransferase